MGEVAILHPQACLKDHSDNLLPIPMKSRRTIKFTHNSTNPSSRTPTFTVPDSRRQTPPKGILKKRDTEAVATEPPAATASKNLVMGQVKILKRGEALEKSSTISKKVNYRKVSSGPTSTSENDLVSDRELFKVPITGRSVLPLKKKTEKNKMSSNSSPKLKTEDLVLSSTHRLGPDPEIVSKQVKNKTECYAGCAFPDSPSPCSVPLPKFSIKNSVEGRRSH